MRQSRAAFFATVEPIGVRRAFQPEDREAGDTQRKFPFIVVSVEMVTTTSANG